VKVQIGIHATWRIVEGPSDQDQVAEFGRRLEVQAARFAEQFEAQFVEYLQANVPGVTWSFDGNGEGEEWRNG
jgi:hypothetical protein